MISDPTFWLYLLNIIVAGLGVLIFAGNWMRLGDATSVYKYITGLLFGIFLKSGTDLYALFLRGSCSYQEFTDFVNSALWDFRAFFVLVPMSFLVGKMYYRFFVKRKNVQGLTK